jgi:modulator of FtsH protease HflC
MMKKLLVPILLLATLLSLSAFFVVNEGQQALVTQFGRPVGGAREAGLHWKVPFIQTVHLFEKRILKWDGDPNQIPTKDKRFIWVDTTARWRIVDPLQFYRSVATERGGLSRLDDIIDSVVRDAVSGHLLVELVRGAGYQAPGDSVEVIELEGTPIATDQLVGREELLAGILAKAKTSMPEYGIELIDVQIKRINYVDQVRQRVYERMISERKKVAAQFRSEGEGEKADILGQMEKELKSITSDAYRQSVEIRGKADATAAAIYASAYNQDRQFYTFLRSLEAYRKSTGENGRLVISTDSDFYRILQQAP